MSVGLKGISCILILIAHFYNMYHWNDNHSISWLHFSKICGNFGANIALVIFMFISGYGLSKSHYKNETFMNFLKKKNMESILSTINCLHNKYYFILLAPI